MSYMLRVQSILAGLAILLFDNSGGFMSHLFHLGLVGLFFIAAVDSSFVPLPIPGVTDVMLLLYAAAHANVALLLVISTVGSALGGYLSHAVGQAGGEQFLEKHVPKHILTRVTEWMEHHAILSVALPAILPPPVPLSPFVLAAGAAHMSRKKFMTSFTISRCARHAIAIWLGVHYGRSVLGVWKNFSTRWGVTILVAFWVVVVVFTAIGIWKLVRTSQDLKRKKLSAA
ncbi:YqaA family protein [Granulicella cerasi]|uniref:YqaA family protein n=1 Tax=Granulicella cerasi TaxID=741063 RepID=A0ABW1ZFQ9_9BACT|nr:VTT domain-containing protein [Granulicella cerasi]